VVQIASQQMLSSMLEAPSCTQHAIPVLCGQHVDGHRVSPGHTTPNASGASRGYIVNGCLRGSMYGKTASLSSTSHGLIYPAEGLPYSMHSAANSEGVPSDLGG
jgi:hypothetical protein